MKRPIWLWPIPDGNIHILITFISHSKYPAETHKVVILVVKKPLGKGNIEHNIMFDLIDVELDGEVEAVGMINYPQV